MIKILLGIFLVCALWFAAWYAMLGPDVARVKASIDYQNQRFKTLNHAITFKADSVRRAGFPFAFRVRVNRPALTMIWGQETYGVSMESVMLESSQAGEGRYRVVLPAAMQAVYAKDGALPEQYFITLSPVPQLALRAAGDSTVCSPFPGQGMCADVAADAPLISYALGLPPRLLLHVARGIESRDIGFDVPSAQVPIFMAIPINMGDPLEIGVNVLQEAFNRPNP